jgi:peptidoglycan/xylan/chitin deacetylase (PgdA/CDA1 family)
MLTFDMDGASGLLRREPSAAKRPSVMSMGDFGPEVGTPRILALLKEHGIAASFFIPGWVAERQPGAVEAVLREGHEVAHHGYMHEAPATIGSRSEEAETLDRGTEALKRVTGETPRGYRSPAWDISEHTLRLLLERGFVYDSSLMGHDIPYLADAATGRPADTGGRGGRGGRAGAKAIVELPVHWSLDDAPYYPFSPAVGRASTLSGPQAVLDAWTWEFDMVHEHGAAFMLTMHPQITGHWARLSVLKRLIGHIQAKPGVEFMRCIDAARGWTPSGLMRAGERPSRELTGRGAAGRAQPRPAPGRRGRNG